MNINLFQEIYNWKVYFIMSATLKKPGSQGIETLHIHGAKAEDARGTSTR